MAAELNFARKAALTVAGIAALALPIVVGMMHVSAIDAQSPAAGRPQFEVASIKRCPDDGRDSFGGGESSPGRLSTGCMMLAGSNGLGLIQRAYVRFAGGRAHLRAIAILPIKGGPSWIRSELYEIDARAEGHPSLEMMQGPMLQVLLEDRFKLKVHRETEERPVYALTLVKGVSKLKPFQNSCLQLPEASPIPKPAPGQRYCNQALLPMSHSIEMEGATMKEFSGLLNLVMDRRVIDQTGVTGLFDIHLEFSSDDATPGVPRGVPNESAAASDPGRPAIFTAMQEQLGLKLVATTGPVEFLVIDHIEKPSEN